MKHFRLTPANDPAVLHFVELDFGKNGRAFRETEAPHTEADVVRCIVHGEYGFPVVRVLAVNPAANAVYDITDQIAWLVFHHIDAANDPWVSDEARTLCERFGHDFALIDAAIERAA